MPTDNKAYQKRRLRSVRRDRLPRWNPASGYALAASHRGNQSGQFICYKSGQFYLLLTKTRLSIWRPGGYGGTMTEGLTQPWSAFCLHIGERVLIPECVRQRRSAPSMMISSTLVKEHFARLRCL